VPEGRERGSYFIGAYMKKVAIIGAGISGVSLAYYLSKHENIAVTLFDNRSEAGGCIKTIQKDGFQVESGPNGVLNSKAHVKELYEEAGLANILQYSSELTKRRYIQMGKKLHLAPMSPISAITTKLLTAGGKIRVLKEPTIPARTDGVEETIAEFTSRRLGSEAADTLIATLVGGIYAGDTTKLSMAAAFPRLYELEQTYGGLVKGMFGKAKARKAAGEPKKKRDKDSYKLISSATGMQGLVQALAEKCKAEFVYNTTVTTITHSGGKYTLAANDKTLGEFDNVALCCNANAIAETTASLDSGLSAEFNKISFSPVFICGMGFKKSDIEQPLDGFGYLVTPSEKSIVLGTLFSSSLFGGRAPKDSSLITVITVGDRNKEAFTHSDEELQTMAYNEVKNVLGIQAQPECAITFRHARAMPQYYVGHLKIKENIEIILEKYDGLYIGGNTFGGVSVADCIATSIALAEKIVK
jgi:oxygen-dependent protoporphyrinogen oxidase